MKFKNNALKYILLANIAFLGLTGQNAYADDLNTEEAVIENQNYEAQATADNPQELTRDPKIESQTTQLQLAVDDQVNVVNSNAYYNYASQELKAEYESAIANAKSVLARKDSASYEELRNAMARINTAKQNI